MKLVVFGDSIVQGLNDAESNGWVTRLASHLTKRNIETNWNEYHAVFSLGIAGNTSDDVLERLEGELSVRGSSRGRILMLAVGINDACSDTVRQAYRVPPERYRANLEAMIGVGERECDSIVLVSLLPIIASMLTPIPWAPELVLTDAAREEYDAVLRSVSHDTNTSLVDVFDVFEADTVYLPDGIHPNAAGHERIFRRVLGFLEEAELLK